MPSHRARRAAQRQLVRAGEGDHRAAHALLHAARDQAHHALVPAGVEQAHPGVPHLPGREVRQAAHRAERLVLHLRLDRAALLVELVEAHGETLGARGIVLEQALDADAHVIEAAGGVQPRRHRRRRDPPRSAPRGCGRQWSSSAWMPATQRPARMRFRPCATSTRLLASSGTTSATVPSATRSSSAATPPGTLECAVHGRHQVESDADAGERAARKAAAGEVGIDDGVGVRQLRARQMVIGNEYVDAACPRGRHPGVAGDAVVHRDQQCRGALGRARHDLGGEPVAEAKAVRHQEVHRREAAGAQRAHHQRAAGGAIGVEVADDQHRVRRGARAAAPRPPGSPRAYRPAAVCSSEVSRSCAERTPRAAYTRDSTGCMAAPRSGGGAAQPRRTMRRLMRRPPAPRGAGATGASGRRVRGARTRR